MRKTFLLTVMFLSSATVLAQPDRAEPLNDNIPLDAYLNMLGEIAPAAREGAVAYMSAYERRCNRPLTVIELRRAIADNEGNPVLMAMMRAAAQYDTAALERLSNAVSCVRGI